MVAAILPAKTLREKFSTGVLDFALPTRLVKEVSRRNREKLKEQHDFDRNYKLEYVRNGKLENVRKFLLENVLEKLCCWKMSEIFLLENDLRKIECWKMS